MDQGLQEQMADLEMVNDCFNLEVEREVVEKF